MNLYFFLVGEMNMELMPEDFKPNTFYIDTRERKRVSDIKKFLFNFIENDALVYDKHKRPFKIQDAKLQIGDYAFMNDKGVSCGFEWKTIDDFRWSTNTNEDSVFRKTIDLINAYDSPHLIIQGDKRQVHNIKDYEMTINSMSHSLNIREPITQEMGFYHIVKIITNFDDGIGIPRKFYNRGFKEAIPLMYHLISTTGIDWKTAKKICIDNNLHTNSDALRLLSMDEKQLEKLNGIGPATAKKINNKMLKVKPWDYVKNN